MNHYTFYFCLLAMCFHFVACDVSGGIIIKNTTPNKIVYRIEMVDTTKWKTSERSIENNTKSFIWYGLGHTWANALIFDYVQNVNKIEIIQPSKTVVITDKKEMYDYFKKRRRGLFKQEVLIKIK